MILLIDNYDSFAHNLARYFRLLGQPTDVVRNDKIPLTQFNPKAYDALVLSPGPQTPDQAGSALGLLDLALGQIPILGICLGHQTIVQSLGGRIVPADVPVHGRTSLIHHDHQAEFLGLPNPLPVARYHSLIADARSIPDTLVVSATTKDGTIMAVRHRELPVTGWQFHPESILTCHGFVLLAAFLRSAGLSVRDVPSIAQERPVPKSDNTRTWPQGVSF